MPESCLILSGIAGNGRMRSEVTSSFYGDFFLVSFYVCASQSYDVFFSFRKA
jgi:hypothetical protein